MSLEASVLASARACEGAAIALSHSLRRPAAAPSAAATLVDTFREAEAFAITVRAVLEEAAPLLPLLAANSRCVGRHPHTVYPGGRVANGFDTIAVVLIALLDTAVDAILDVAGNQTRWLVSPMQASATFERMVGHHGQLRAMYGIVHLAAKIVSRVDTEETLFVDVRGDGSHPELEPGKWRAAIKMDDFYGRHFGFHYAPEMRSVLRVVNIARGSVHKSHQQHDETSPLIKNMTMLGWGWVYSNMVLMNNLGLNIDGVAQIGADSDRGGMSIQALRKFMNLVEEPLVAGVTGLTGVDVAMDKVFEIPKPGDEEGLEGPDSPVHSEKLKNVLVTVDEPVRARLMSFRHRPVSLPEKKQKQLSGKQKHQENKRAGKQTIIHPALGHTLSESKATNGKTRGPVVVLPVKNSLDMAAFVPEPGSTIHAAGKDMEMKTSSSKEKQGDTAKAQNKTGEKGKKHEAVLCASSPKHSVPSQMKEVPTVHSIVAAAGTSTLAGADLSGAMRDTSKVVVRMSEGNSSPSSGQAKVTGKGKKGVTEGSYLASTIKSELFKLQSNVSILLGMEEARPASGLILHFHGGGFVSQSSEGHALYLKEWCAEIPDAVLLSIDYKLAPEHKFPVALHEGVYAYIWAMQNAERLGTRCDRIVFAGDSAGGNLAVAAALLVNELGLRAPDGVCVAYPALYVNVAWSPSRLLSFFDPLLPLSVLELCVKSYLPLNEEDKGQECAFLSPVVAGEEALRVLAPVAMICGSFDPLLDDAVLFAHRLRKAGRKKDVLRVYEAMPHGFLNLQQVNVKARNGMRFMAKTMAEYLGVGLRKGSKAALADMEDEVQVPTEAYEG